MKKRRKNDETSKLSSLAITTRNNHSCGIIAIVNLTESRLNSRPVLSCFYSLRGERRGLITSMYANGYNRGCHEHAFTLLTGISTYYGTVDKGN